jgi:hypothetical protein
VEDGVGLEEKLKKNQRPKFFFSQIQILPAF